MCQISSVHDYTYRYITTSDHNRQCLQCWSKWAAHHACADRVVSQSSVKAEQPNPEHKQAYRQDHVAKAEPHRPDLLQSHSAHDLPVYTSTSNRDSADTKAF